MNDSLYSTMMSDRLPYPLFLQVAQRPVLIVGGGAVGLRKARGLCEAGAEVTVVSLTFHEGFEQLPHVHKRVGGYQTALMAGDQGGRRWRLVFAATDDPALNAQVQRDATEAGILVCRCDEPEAGDFSGGATHQQPGLTVAVSTQGGAPSLAARMREQAVAAIDPELIAWSQRLKQWREEVLAALPEAALRRKLLLRLASAEMERLWREEGAERAQACFSKWLAEARGEVTERPHV